MEQISVDTNIGIKSIEINEGENKYKCNIQSIKDFIEVSLYIGDNIKYEGNIHISKIQNQIGTFINYNINEIFEEINLLNKDNFSIIKKSDKNILKIEFIILRKKQYLYIDLLTNQNLNNNDLIQTISQLKEIIKSKDNMIQSLQQKLKQYQPILDDNSYNSFDIKLKEPKHILNYHTRGIACSTLLNDGRFATGSGDNSIIIYNDKTYKPDLTIKEHKDSVYSLIQLNSGILVSGSSDNTIKLFNINGNSYNVIQTLTYHTDWVGKIIELYNNKLVSCSIDQTINFYLKENNKYKKDFTIYTNGSSGPIIQIKNNEICYYEGTNSALCFYDLEERKIITKLNNISVNAYSWDTLIMMSKDLLLAAGDSKLTIININSHSVIRTIDVTGSSDIFSICLLNNELLLTGDYNHNIIEWKIENDNLRQLSKKENAHDTNINTITKIGNGLIMSGDGNGQIKIW